MKLPIIDKLVRTETKTSYSIELSGADIINLLNEAGVAAPKNAVVEFDVPGGGDWSNMSVDIDQDNPVTVRWTETTYA